MASGSGGRPVYEREYLFAFISVRQKALEYGNVFLYIDAGVSLHCGYGGIYHNHQQFFWVRREYVEQSGIFSGA